MMDYVSGFVLNNCIYGRVVEYLCRILCRSSFVELDPVMRNNSCLSFHWCICRYSEMSFSK